MDVWISGAFALIGAIAGVAVSSTLATKVKRSDARRERLADALKKTTAALAASNFATRIGGSNPPPGIQKADLNQLEVKLFLGNLERYYLALHEARHSVALLAGDGVNIGESWQTAEDFQADLEALCDRLAAALRAA